MRTQRCSDRGTVNQHVTHVGFQKIQSQQTSGGCHCYRGFADFHKIIKDFTSEKRGRVLQQKGTDRAFRYRFRNPAMQPFVIMKGIEEGFLNEEAKLALSSPEQPDLFSTG